MEPVPLFPRELSRKPRQLLKQGILPVAVVNREHVTELYQTAPEALKAAALHADKHGSVRVQVAGEPAPRTVMIRRADQDPLRGVLTHVTFVEVHDGDAVKAEVPIVVIHPLEDSGREVTLTQMLTTLRVKGSVRNLPDHVEVDARTLALGQHVEARDIVLPEGIVCLTPLDATVVTLSLNRGAAEPTPAEPAA